MKFYINSVVLVKFKLISRANIMGVWIKPGWKREPEVYEFIVK